MLLSKSWIVFLLIIQSSFGQDYVNVNGDYTPDTHPHGSSCSSHFLDKLLYMVNRYRAIHKAEPLNYSSELNSFAQEFADYLKDTKQFVTRSKIGRATKGYGELMCWHTERIFDEDMASFCVDLWYDTKIKYDWSVPTASIMNNYNIWRMFAQLVWRNTTHMGVGCSKSYDYSWVVADFDPPGNIPCMYPTNVKHSYVTNEVQENDPWCKMSCEIEIEDSQIFNGHYRHDDRYIFTSKKTKSSLR
ncbi:hypothetical protein BLOT_008563 [Blomia tropicalis]|nr:hypothetical protein BLOT_008563 [Blomia tropicalis]